MIDFLKRIFGFIKQNPLILVSLFLIIFLPLILWGNTVFIIKSFESKIDFILQEKALIIENILAEFVSEKISEPDLLQEKLNEIVKQSPEIKNLRIIIFENDKFKIIVSQDQREIKQEISDPSFSIAWHQEENIAHLISEGQERFWKVVRPLKNNKGEKIALISLNLSLKKIDDLFIHTVQISYIIIIVAILIVLFLILYHAKLFQYLKLYKELQKIEDLRKNFFRMAIHELQSPIVNIRGYIEILQEQIEDKILDEDKENLRRISISAKSLSELVEDILKVVKIEHQALDLTPQQILPYQIVSETVDLTRQKVEQKNLNFNYYRVEEKNWTIRVNPNRFQEILTNLIENAIKYTIQGKIEIKEWVDAVKERYYLSIEDTGIGISGEEQKNLFQKFYRIKSKETSDIPGTGLGLWIVKNLCEGMKGKILVESIKGIGTKFTICFPAIRIKM